MAAYIKTITSVTEQGLHEIAQAINYVPSRDDFTREIGSAMAAFKQQITDTQDATEKILRDIQYNLQAAIVSVGENVVGQILVHQQVAAITPDIWRRIEVSMRVLHQIEALVLADTFSRETANAGITDLKTKKEFEDSYTTLKDNSKFNAVCAEFTTRNLEEQRRQRLADIMQLRLDIIRHHTTQTQTESK